PAGPETAFSFLLMPKGFSPTTCDQVQASIHYHTISGDSGSLSLNELSLDMRLLARLLDTDIKAYDFVITPTGLQRGDSANLSRLGYEPIDFRGVVRSLNPAGSELSEAELKDI